MGLADAGRVHRDDGPLVALGAGARPPASSLPLQLAGLVLLAAGLAMDTWRGPNGRLGVAVVAGVAAFVASGVLSSAARPTASLGWLVAPLIRTGEYGFIAWSTWRVGAGPAGYLLAAALAYHHYDLVYRLRYRALAPPRWLTMLGGGWDLRLVVLVVAGSVGSYRPVAAVLAVWCGGLYVFESVRSWRGADSAGSPVPAADGADGNGIGEP